MEEKLAELYTFMESIRELKPEFVDGIIGSADVIFESSQPKSKTRPNPVFDANDPDVLDDKDHFPLGDVDQARNALARVNQYDETPKWWKGTSLADMKKKVADAVKKEFPSIEVTDESYN